MVSLTKYNVSTFLQEADLPFQRIYKRLIDLSAPTEIVKQIIVNIEAGVEVEVTIAA